MGIVVSLAMLLGIIFLSFKVFYQVHRNSLVVRIGLVFILLVGLWNSLWYGMQNIQTFWGITGLISGVLMLLCAQLLYKNIIAEARPVFSIRYVARISIIIGLALCFCLYVITLFGLI